jgi:hypothetical protein
MTVIQTRCSDIRVSESGLPLIAPMPAMGLGRVETTSRREAAKGKATQVILAAWQHFRIGNGFCGLGGLCDIRQSAKSGQSDGDYALIAARRGWMPMMFMTRVRL